MTSLTLKGQVVIPIRLKPNISKQLKMPLATITFIRA